MFFSFYKLIVKFKANEIKEVQLKFKQDRNVLPPVFILTSFDGFKKESIWTNEKPTIQQLCRIVQVANHSLAALKNSIFNFQSTEEIKVYLIFINF